MANDQPVRRRDAQRKTFNRRIEQMLVDVTEYTENTSIHGVKYLCRAERPFVEKLYWIILFVICFLFLGSFIQEIQTKWQEHFVIMVEDDIPTPVFKIPFPAITICPQAKVKVNEFSYHQYYEFEQKKKQNLNGFSEYFKKFQIAQQICHHTTTQMFKHKDTEQFLNKSYIELLYQISPSYWDTFFEMEMPNSCRMFNLSYPEHIDFATILTNEGLCYTFNMPSEILRNETLQNEYPYHNITQKIQGWNYENGFTPNSTFPRRSCSAGEASSLQIDLAAHLTNLNSLCQPTYVGYKIILHSPATYPTTFESYIPVNHESWVKIGVTPKIITTSESLRSYTIEQRQCYFNDERKLQFFRFYNRINCKLECFANYTLKHHNCVHFAFPRSIGTKICGANLHMLHIYEMVDSLDTLINYLDDFPDDHDFADLMKNVDAPQSFSCDCLPECNSIEYEYKIITETVNYEKLQSEISHVWNDSVIKQFAPVQLQIYWNEAKITGKTRKQLYSFADFISNFGGLLGLFMGGSILSFFEIVYFCVLRQVVNCARLL